MTVDVIPADLLPGDVVVEVFDKDGRLTVTVQRKSVCGQVIWPYTEANICVLKPGHSEKLHEDGKGRKFDVGGYVSKKDKR